MIVIALGGICQCCHRYSLGLFRCHACGANVCPLCVVEGTAFCKICKGTKQVDTKQIKRL